MRRLKSFLGLTAGEGAWRVVIVDAADDLNINAANALLKSLEEPPPRALFLLVSSEPSRLLPTIRSRSRRLDLSPLAPEPLKRAVSAALAAADQEMPSDKDWARLERLAKGSVRRALQLAASGGLELHERIEAMLKGLPKVDWPAAHALSDQLAVNANEQRFEAFYDLLLDTLARLASVRAKGQGGAEERALAERLIPEHRLPAWAALWEQLLRDKNEAQELNLDKKALILGCDRQAGGRGAGVGEVVSSRNFPGTASFGGGHSTTQRGSGPWLSMTAFGRTSRKAPAAGRVGSPRPSRWRRRLNQRRERRRRGATVELLLTTRPRRRDCGRAFFQKLLELRRRPAVDGCCPSARGSSGIDCRLLTALRQMRRRRSSGPIIGPNGLAAHSAVLSLRDGARVETARIKSPPSC